MKEVVMLSLYLSMLNEEEDKQRFESIYSKYRNMMGKLAFSILSDENAAFDATHDALVAIAKNIKSFPPASDELYERAYIKTVVRRFCINHMHKIKNVPPVLELNDDFDYESDIQLSEQISEKDHIIRITHYIENMSEVYRDVLTLRYVYEMTAGEIACATGLSIETVRTKIKRGSKLVQRYIEKELTV